MLLNFCGLGLTSEEEENDRKGRINLKALGGTLRFGNQRDWMGFFLVKRQRRF